MKYFNSRGKPDSIIVDGGKSKVSSFTEMLEGDNIPIVVITKRFESIIIKNIDCKYTQFDIPKGPSLNLIQRNRNEAHRFAQRYHHFLFKKSMIG